MWKLKINEKIKRYANERMNAIMELRMKKQEVRYETNLRIQKMEDSKFSLVQELGPEGWQTVRSVELHN
jgi:hypothetical protein